MNIKNHLKKLLISNSIIDSDDENEQVEWLQPDEDKIKSSQPVIQTEKFNCGCCDDCSCDDNIACSNCCCGCCDNNDNVSPDKPGFEINIINEEKEKKVRITLEFNVKLSNNMTKLISIDVDINMNTYLKIADELIQE